MLSQICAAVKRRNHAGFFSDEFNLGILEFVLIMLTYI